MSLLDIIICGLVLGVVVLLCSFLCILANAKEELWDSIKEKEEDDSGN